MIDLDGTKIGLPEHQERLRAWLSGERVAPITMDMALTQKCQYACKFCVPPDEPILMADGTQKPMRLISIGDSVASFDGIKIVKSTVLAHWQTGLSEPIIRVSTNYGSVRCTANHPILTDKGWLAAGALKKGDKIAAYRRAEEDSARKIGGMVGIAEGGRNQTKNYRGQQDPHTFTEGAPSFIKTHEPESAFWESPQSWPDGRVGKGTPQKENIRAKSQRENDGVDNTNAASTAESVFEANENQQSYARPTRAPTSSAYSFAEIWKRIFFQSDAGELGQWGIEAASNVRSSKTGCVSTNEAKQPYETPVSGCKGRGDLETKWLAFDCKRSTETKMGRRENNVRPSAYGISERDQQDGITIVERDSTVRLQIHGRLGLLDCENAERVSSQSRLYLAQRQEQDRSFAPWGILAPSSECNHETGNERLRGDWMEDFHPLGDEPLLQTDAERSRKRDRGVVAWSEVTQIEDAGYSSVYDLTCAPHHNFIASGVVVHNCYAQVQQNPSDPVSWDTWSQFLDDCVEIGHKPGEGVKAISLVSDGESTMSKSYYPFIAKAKSLGIDIASGTNGEALKQDQMPMLLESLTYLRINFNAADPNRYAEIMGAKPKAFDRVVANIEELVRLKKLMGSKTTIGLQMVLMPEYADQAVPLAEFGRQLGVDYLVIKHVTDDEEGRLGIKYDWYTSPEATAILKSAEARSTSDYSVQVKWSKIRTGRDRKYSRCYGTPLLFQMSGSGIVAPCGSFFHERYKDRWIGDIKTERFKDIWASQRYLDVINFLKSDEFDPRYDCAALCLQDKVNEALFNLIEYDSPLPYVSGDTIHGNFI